MRNLDFKSITKDMLASMQEAAAPHMNDVRELAAVELENFAKRTAALAMQVADGSISEEQARAILRIRQNAVEAVLLSIAGINAIAAQDALNAAIGVLRNVINTSIPGVSIL